MNDWMKGKYEVIGLKIYVGKRMLVNGKIQKNTAKIEKNNG